MPLGTSRLIWERHIKLDIRNRVEGCGLDSASSGTGPVERSYEYGNELPDFIKG
jgi:hypothetical protein